MKESPVNNLGLSRNILSFFFPPVDFPPMEHCLNLVLQWPFICWNPQSHINHFLSGLLLFPPESLYKSLLSQLQRDWSVIARRVCLSLHQLHLPDHSLAFYLDWPSNQPQNVVFQILHKLFWFTILTCHPATPNFALPPWYLLCFCSVIWYDY